MFCYGVVVGYYYDYGVSAVVGEDDLASLCEGARDYHKLLLGAGKLGEKTVIVACGEFDPLRSQSRNFFLDIFIRSSG